MGSLAKIETIPYDVFGVKKMGVDQWFEDFYFPVDPTEFLSLWLDMESCFLNIGHSSTSPYKDVLYAAGKVPFLLAQWAHVLLAERGAKEMGKRLMVHEQTEYTELLEVGKGKTPPISCPILFNHKYWEQRIRAYLKAFKYSLKSGFALQTLNQLNSEKKYFATSMRYPLLRAYCRQNDIFPILAPLEFFMGSQKEVMRESKWEAIGRALVEEFAQIIEKYCGSLSPGQHSYIKDYLIKNLNAYYRLFHNILQRLRSFSKSQSWTLLATSLGEPTHRILYQTFRYHGGQVIGFSHGNVFARPVPIDICIKEFSLCDEYVVGGRHSILLHEFYLKYYTNRYEYIRYINPKSISCVENFYKPLAATNGKNTESSCLQRIEKLMILGTPFYQHQSGTIPGGFGIRWLYLELQIVNMLKDAGFHVIYKAHPDRLRESQDIFKDRVDMILTEPFETVWDQADCFVNVTWGSTTYGYALRTGKPAIIVNTLGAPWPKKLLDVIKDRYFFVRTLLDEQNGISLVKGDLEHALQSLKNVEIVKAKLRNTQESFNELMR